VRVTRLILWRHGRTAWNHSGRIQGQLDTDLDEVGVAQAAAAAPALAALAPELVVSSDLSRASRTAQFLGELTGLSVTLDPRLRERHFGRWEGLTSEEIAERYPDEHAAWRRGEPEPDPTIEPLAALGDRSSAALREVAERLDGTGTAVVVTHGGAARAGAATLLGLPPSLWHGLAALRNCAVSDLRLIPNRGWTLQGHNLLGPDGSPPGMPGR
jgi:probable phosphoglycerate mutase